MIQKKVFTLVMAFALALSMSVVSFAEESTDDVLDRNFQINAWIQNLEDVSQEDWFYPILPGIYDVMKGVSDTQFVPNQPMSRAMFATIIYRLDGEPNVGIGGERFIDVPPGQWYSNAVNWAESNGIVNGVGENRFAPTVDVTREQMAVMLKNYSDYKKAELRSREKISTPFSSFSDLSSVSPWARESMKWAVEKGLVKGTTVGLEPQATATRAQVAQLVYNYIMMK